nr:hypothetical protein [Tanacetum cinerariifolium]
NWLVQKQTALGKDTSNPFMADNLPKIDEGIELVVDQEKDAEVEGRHADKQAEIYNINLDLSSKVLSMQEDDTEVQEAVEVVTTAKLMTEVVTATATQVVAASTPISAAKPKILKIAAAPATPIVKDKGKGILIEAPKPMKKKDQAEKRRKLSEEAQEADDLKKRLEIVQDEDDDVFVEAIPLVQKVPVVDYQVVVIDNKPKEDLETLWRIVKKFSTSKPTNFSDELDEQDAIWRNQKSVHGLALVKRWKLLTSCGVHVIILSTVQLFLLVER